MGLPLFVEPTEPEISNKTHPKSGLTSPSHADSRNVPSRSEIRDRRNGIRRAGVRIYGPMQRTTRNSRERFLPWVESPREQDRAGSSAADRRSGMFREALREMTGRDDRRRELEERMSSLFGSSWRRSPQPAPSGTGEPESLSESLDFAWWSVDPPLPPPPPVRTYDDTLEDETTPMYYNSVPGIPSRQVPSLFGRPVPGVYTDLPAVVPLTTGTPRPQLGGYDRDQHHTSRRHSARRRFPLRRTTRGVDGLGDRDRSLSPEVWDTLLSTLTPDPQPPSAGSSFASVAASQTGGPSSGTSTTAPDVVDEVQLEGVCESGCECSDNDMDTVDYEHPDYARIRRRRQESGSRPPGWPAASFHVPDSNPDGTLDRSDDPLFNLIPPFTSRDPGEGRTTRQINTPNGSLTIYEATIGLPGSNDALSRSASRSTQQPTTDGALASPRLGDAAQAQDADRDAVDGPQTTQEAPTSADPSPAEDEWAGMQRIVRSLARREDIPDGWWAEAGLSRILRQGANSSNQSGSRSHDMF